MSLTPDDRKLIRNFLARKKVRVSSTASDTDLCKAMSKYFVEAKVEEEVAQEEDIAMAKQKFVEDHIQMIKARAEDVPCVANEEVDVNFRYVMANKDLPPYNVNVDEQTFQGIIFSDHTPGIVRFRNRNTGRVEYGTVTGVHNGIPNMIQVSKHIGDQVGTNRRDLDITLCLPEFFEEESYVMITMFGQDDEVVEQLNRAIAQGDVNLISDLPFIQLGMKIHSDAIDPSIALYITRIKSEGRDMYVARLPQNVTKEIQVDVENLPIA